MRHHHEATRDPTLEKSGSLTGAAVASIDHRVEYHTLANGVDQLAVQIIVNDMSRPSVVKRDEGFVHPVCFLSSVVASLATVATVVKEQRVPCCGAGDQPSNRLQDVSARRVKANVAVLLRQHDNVLVLEMELGLEQVAHTLGVIDASAELLGGASVVDADQQGFAPSYGRRRAAGLRDSSPSAIRVLQKPQREPSRRACQRGVLRGLPGARCEEEGVLPALAHVRSADRRVPAHQRRETMPD